NDFQLGFQSTLGRMNYSVSALRYRLGDGRQDTRYAFTLSVPLGRSANAPRASTQLSNDFQLGFQSTLGRMNYSVSALRYRLGDGRQDT
ncbi:hypothetical protein, partial [Escherichia coli]|uniref:hypothetical protein n=1 Tax=Escherichia coli TaxID=562 RepID=UPI000BD63063